MRSVIDRFMKFVNKTDTCWLWTGYCDKDGYGQCFSHYKSHRISYELFVGPIPDGLSVLHTCDVPKCVNPGHLFLGTQLTNIRDMDSKGRRTVVPFKSGEEHHNHKLTETQVIEIRRLRTLGMTTTDLAKQYNTSSANISYITKGYTWRHLHAV